MSSLDGVPLGVSRSFFMFLQIHKCPFLLHLLQQIFCCVKNAQHTFAALMMSSVSTSFFSFSSNSPLEFLLKFTSTNAALVSTRSQECFGICGRYPFFTVVKYAAQRWLCYVIASRSQGYTLLLDFGRLPPTTC